jgi:hypothetical protein
MIITGGSDVVGAFGRCEASKERTEARRALSLTRFGHRSGRSKIREHGTEEASGVVAMIITGGSEVVGAFVSTAEQKCIGWPEQKYISGAGRKARRTGGPWFRHQAWIGLSAGVSELAGRGRRLL